MMYDARRFVDLVGAAVGQVPLGRRGGLLDGAPTGVGLVVFLPARAHQLSRHVTVGGVHDQADGVATQREGDGTTLVVLRDVGDQ